jgi:hypothetical protein
VNVGVGRVRSIVETSGNMNSPRRAIGSVAVERLEFGAPTRTPHLEMGE